MTLPASPDAIRRMTVGSGCAGGRGRSARATGTDGYDKAFIASLMPSDTPTSFGSALIAIAASFSL